MGDHRGQAEDGKCSGEVGEDEVPLRLCRQRGLRHRPQQQDRNSEIEREQGQSADARRVERVQASGQIADQDDAEDRRDDLYDGSDGDGPGATAARLSVTRRGRPLKELAKAAGATIYASERSNRIQRRFGGAAGKAGLLGVADWRRAMEARKPRELTDDPEVHAPAITAGPAIEAADL
jgi:hypothetical protein